MGPDGTAHVTYVCTHTCALRYVTLRAYAHVCVTLRYVRTHTSCVIRYFWSPRGGFTVVALSRQLVATPPLRAQDPAASVAPRHRPTGTVPG